jgi:hypothetical protein
MTIGGNRKCNHKFLALTFLQPHLEVGGSRKTQRNSETGQRIEDWTNEPDGFMVAFLVHSGC